MSHNKNLNSLVISWLKLSALVSCSLLPALAARADNSCLPSEILKDDKFIYNDSLSTWLSYADFLVRRTSDNKSSSNGLTYSGVSLNTEDARSLSDYYKREAKYNISIDQQTSVLYTYLGQNRLEAYTNCLKYQHNNFLLRVSPGSQEDKLFEIIVEWRPKYQVELIDGKNIRKPKITIANGAVMDGGDQTIAPDKDLQLLIERSNLDEPFSFVVSIDGRSSEILKFPAKPSRGLSLKTKKLTTDQINRNTKAGKSGIKTGPYCIHPDEGKILLPSTASLVITGGGNEWQGRTGISYSEKTPNSVCFVMESRGEICEECAYYYRGYMSVSEAAVEK